MSYSLMRGVASLNTNRKFIGIEIDEYYSDVSKNRIEQHVALLGLI